MFHPELAVVVVVVVEELEGMGVEELLGYRNRVDKVGKLRRWRQGLVVVVLWLVGW